MIVVDMIAQATAPAEVRIDTFDRKSNRSGYVIFNPSTGRYDSFDVKGNRTGWGTISNPPRSYEPRPPDRDREREKK